MPIHPGARHWVNEDPWLDPPESLGPLVVRTDIPETKGHESDHTDHPGTHFRPLFTAGIVRVYEDTTKSKLIGTSVYDLPPST